MNTNGCFSKLDKFLSIVLASVIVISIFSGFTVFAEDTAPMFDITQDTELTNQLGFVQGGGCYHYQYSAETGAKFWNDVYTEGKYVQLANISSNLMGEKTKFYASGNIKYLTSINDSYAQYYFPAVTTTYVTRTSKTGNLEHGYISVVFKGNNQPATLGFWPIDRADGQQNIIYNIKSFPEIKTSIGDSHDFVYSLDKETNNLNFWIDGTKVLSDFCLSTETDEYGGSFSEFEHKLGVSTAYAQIILSDYRVWRERDEEEFSPKFPVYSSDIHKKILSTSTSWKDNTTTEFESILGINDKKQPIYTSITVNPSADWDNWSSIYMSLAETDYKESEHDTRTWYFGIRLTGRYGYFVGLFSNNEQTNLIKEYGTYSDGTYQLKTTGVTFTTLVYENKITVWMDGKVICDSFSSDTYNILGIVVGTCAMKQAYTSHRISNVCVWVTNDNYGKLGDINGDEAINILDLIRAKKLESKTPGVTYYNEYVINFDGEGHIGTTGMISLKKYLMGIITEKELYPVIPEYSDQGSEVPSDELL